MDSIGYSRLLDPGESEGEARAKLLAALAPTQQVIEAKEKARTPCAKEQQRGPFRCVACNGAGETAVLLPPPPHFEPCGPCGGKGKVMFLEVCNQCNGTGEIKHPHFGKKIRWAGGPKFTTGTRPPLHTAPDGGPLHRPPCGDCRERTEISVSRSYEVTP